MTARDAMRAIKKDGWVQISTHGSHYQFKHPAKPGKVTIPYHSGDLPIIVLKSISKQAGVKL